MLYFIRHGATDWNENKNAKGEKCAKCQGQADIPLNELGILQAQAAVKVMKNIKLDKIICSPLQRAKQTCDIINTSHVPVIYDKRLMERNFGEFEGLTREEFNFEGFWNGDTETYGRGAETISALRARVYDLLTELEDEDDKNILLVSHGGVGLMVTEYFKGKPKNYNYLEYGVPNCKLLMFDFQNPI